MFIEPVVSITRAPAERNVYGDSANSRFRFAPLERGILWSSARSINITSLRDGGMRTRGATRLDLSGCLLRRCLRWDSTLLLGL